MASSFNYYTPQFTCKEGILHIYVINRWKKNWIILSGSSLVIYKKKSKENVPKFVFDLTKAIAISSPFAVEPECPSLPPKIPFFRGFAIRFNETANKKIFAAFAFSHQDCLQWVQSVRFNTNSSQLPSPVSFPGKSIESGRHEFIENDPNSIRPSTSKSISSIQNSKIIENLTHPDLISPYRSNSPNDADLGNYPPNLQSIGIETCNCEADIFKTKCLQMRSCSMTNLRIDCELFVESNNTKLPPPPPYNPSYN